jgi:hypothetical protein
MKPQHAIVVALGVVALAGCAREDGRAPAPGPQDEAAAAPTNRIDIPATVRSNLGITFVRVERRRVEGTIRVPGAFELQPRARHEYRMTLSGRVALLVDQYQAVEPGDLLYRFRSPEWPALQQAIIAGEQAIDSARAEIEIARARITEAERRLELMRERLAMLAEAEFRQADLEAGAAELEASLPRLRAELRQAETKLSSAERTREHALHNAAAATNLAESSLAEEVEHTGEMMPAYRAIDWIDVEATRPGIVEMLAVADGAFAEAPSLVVSTVDPSRLRFRAMALQADLVRLTGSVHARIVPPMTPGVPIADGVDATVTIGLEAHPDQRTVTLLAAPEGERSWTRAGVSAFLEVVVESTGGPALAIPRSAIVKDGIVHVFFRRDPQDPNQAIRVEADMGVSDGRWVAINSGISPNDEIVLDGAYELKLASQQSGASGQGGHFHADGTFHGSH